MLDWHLAEKFLPRLAAAMICGLILGAEREFRNKPAGLKTLVLLCLGSCVFVVTGEMLLLQSAPGGAGPAGDPTRVLGQIVTGVGFIGAGVIMHATRTVTGITTAASIWLAAAIGAAIGCGYYIFGFLVTLSSVAFLLCAGPFESTVLGKCQFSTCRLRYRADRPEVRFRLETLLQQHDIRPDKFEVAGDGEYAILEFPYCTAHRSHSAFVPELQTIEGVVKVDL
jgi:putative Mg2+ transporter-C (MgtC) family protein